MNTTGTSRGHRSDHSLTERYVHATLRAVPQDRRDDLGAELRSTVDDMVQARIDTGQPPQQAERDALVELGDPAVLAARYAQAPLHLLGPTYYLVWKRLLLQLLAWIPALVATIAAAAEVLEGSTTVGDVIASAIVAGAGTAIQICFWLTLVFVFIDRVAGDADMPEWTPDRLPEVPVEREYPFCDAAAGIAFNLVVGGLLVLQQFRSWVDAGDGDDLPILDPDLWGSWLPFLLAVLVVDVALEVWKYRHGWTLSAVVTVVLTSVAFAAPVAWLASQDRLLNPEFLAAVDLGATGRDNLALAVAIGAILVAAWETGEAIVKGVLRRRDPRG